MKLDVQQGHIEIGYHLEYFHLTYDPYLIQKKMKVLNHDQQVLQMTDVLNKM
jgi:hypothetical protein